VRRLALPFALLALAGVTAGGASSALPSADTPNPPGTVTIPFALQAPPPVPEQRSYDQLLALWQSAGSAYGVPWEVLGAINKIESNFGRNMGPSSAGALGWMQFMPSTWERWGLDADDDGVANPWDPDDAVYAAARYLAAAGAATDLSRAIFAYNHADWYVQDVLELASVFSGGGGFDPTLGVGMFGLTSGADAVFQLDDLERRLADARRDVNRAQREVLATGEEEQKLDAAVLAAEQQAGDPNLTDEEFTLLEEQVTALVLQHESSLAKLGRKQADLAEAVQLVNDLQGAAAGQASTITFTRGGFAAGLGSPQFSGQWVFPVGGGPSVVSTAATHHDYPAADIAAPEGSPLYALADGIVIQTFPEPTTNCGVGFSMQVADGSTYLYCHLSYMEPMIQPGTALAAGTGVGLVGSTGHSTGPHLHLQFVPADRYPQAEPWFQSFAGIAFSWQGEPAAPSEPAIGVSPVPSGPVITFSRD
jgi:murein DD-endopeptidase MepM/ murein hydrolase activator NlpD